MTILGNKTTTGFRFFTKNVSAFADYAFAFTVNATNATLPSTFTEEQIQSVLDYISTGRMSGEVTMWSGSTVPSGWLECNGQSTSGYTALAAVVGANVPDLRGEFVRGWDNGRGVDTGRALLSTQDDEFEEHNHTYSASSGTSAQIGTGTANLSSNYSATSGDTGGDETRPRNVALMYIIKT
jgi:microcystin-dependent protein